MSKSPVVLIIRDGWGISPNGESKAKEEGNATLLADTPFHDYLYSTYPMSTVSASGLDVGLPDGQMGNSEVGHMNLGAGRIIYQDLTRINKSISDNEFQKNEVLLNALEKAKLGRLHLIGLVSDGGVHSHIEHLKALIKTANQEGVSDVMIHAISDGRDTSPTGGVNYLKEIQPVADENNAKIATVIGRYYAMDRDKRWERNQIAWDALVYGKGTDASGTTPDSAIQASYENEVTDEFLKPLIFNEHDKQRIRDGDVVLWFNFRADRARQISEAFLYPTFDSFDLHGDAPKVDYFTFTEYDENYGVPVVFPSQEIKEGLGEIVSRAGLNQLRIAETEKYPHVTYFFNGGIEEPFEGQTCALANSPKVATYDLQPEMSAPEVTEKVLAQLADNDLVILNFANPDMVGHTGDVEAAVKAVETIDDSVQKITEATLALGGKLLITADHGNCEKMRNEDGSPHTAHTTNLVHFIYVADDANDYTIKNGILADVAPTLLDLLEVEKPTEMTGKSLVLKK